MSKKSMTLALEALGEILESFETDGKFCKSSLIRNELFDRIKATFEKCKAIADAEQEQRSDSEQLGEPVAIPEGFSLVAVKGFDELMYWLDRCERKGHLENCPDLIEPYEAFDYRTIDTTPQPAQKPWVGLTDAEYLEAESVVWVTINLDSDEKEANREFYKAIEAKLKEKNNV